MRSFYALVLIGLSTLAILSCRVSLDKSQNPEENPITSYLASDSTFTSFVVPEAREYGIVFSALVPGKITELGSKMPEAGSYQVTLWDYNSKTVMRQSTVQQASPGVLALVTIKELVIDKNKKYVISINNQFNGVKKKAYYITKKSGIDFLPFTRENIAIYNSCYRPGITSAFPDFNPTISFAMYGLCEFTFIAN